MAKDENLNRLAEAATFKKRIIAEMAADALRAEGIPAVVTGIEPGMFGPAQHHHIFSARLLVPGDAVEESRNIIAHLMDDYEAPEPGNEEEE